MRSLICFLALLLAMPGRVPAQPCPPIGTSTIPACFSLVGAAGGLPAHSFGRFQIVARDIGNYPCAGARVTVDLSGCPDLHLCADQLDPTVVVDCAAKTVSGLTAADGSVSCTLLGGSNGTGNAVSLLGPGKLYVNGSSMSTPTVSASDLDGVNGVGINDLSVWLTDFGTFGNPAVGRSDFDCSGSVGINDFSAWLTAQGRGDQTESCGATCPSRASCGCFAPPEDRPTPRQERSSRSGARCARSP